MSLNHPNARPAMSEIPPVPCPITGLAPVRHVQRVSPTLLKDLWRIAFGVDVSSSFGTVRRFDLWESPTGLYYFDPPLAGDTAFYTALYTRLLRGKGYYSPGDIRGVLRVGAREIRDGERVLDIGCGYGELHSLIPNARYVGLDPHLADDVPGARKESLEDHLKSAENAYDVACAFEVIEHTADPALMVRNMARAVRPSGRVIVSVPRVPSAMTRVPNFQMSAPPHHLTWWTEPALRAVAAQAGLEAETVVIAPWCKLTSQVYWIERFSLIKSGDTYYRHSWPLHATSAIAWTLGLAANRLRGVPKGVDDEGPNLVMVARKPG